MNAPASDPRPEPPARYRCLSVLEGPIVKMAGVSCRDFATLKSASLCRPLAFNERVRLRLHARVCGLCKNFGRQLEILSLLTADLEQDPPPADPDEPELREQSQRVQQRVRDEVKRAGDL